MKILGVIISCSKDQPGYMNARLHTHLQDMTTVEAAAHKVPFLRWCLSVCGVFPVSTGGPSNWIGVMDMSLGLQNSHGTFLCTHIHG